MQSSQAWKHKYKQQKLAQQAVFIYLRMYVSVCNNNNKRNIIYQLESGKELGRIEGRLAWCWKGNEENDVILIQINF